MGESRTSPAPPGRSWEETQPARRGASVTGMAPGVPGRSAGGETAGAPVPASAVSACAVPPPLQSEASTVWRTPALEGNRPVIVPATPPLMLPRGVSGPAGPSLPCPQQPGPGSWTLHQDFREYDAGVCRWVMTWTYWPDTATEETREPQETQEPQQIQEEDSELGAEPDLGVLVRLRGTRDWIGMGGNLLNTNYELFVDL